jgi:glycosyltransferase involved in cell wall biosynthesis
VVGVGGIQTHKRVDLAIEAVAGIGPPRPTLVWIGNVVDREYLRNLTALAARVDVVFTPLIDVPQATVIDVLNEAAVMIHTSRLEPFGYAPLEAGACGLPVVAKAEGGVRETIIHDKTGLLVERDSALPDALNRVLQDKSLATQMRSAARENVERNWALDVAIDRLEAHLLEVAATK